jgi:hypothetical protein
MKGHRVTFSEAAHMIVSGTPRWLPAFLEWWSQGVRHDCIADAVRPTNAQTKKRLAELHAAATLIERELRAHLIRDVLEVEPLGPIRNAPTLRMSVLDLAKRAQFVSASPLLSRPDGRTKPGRNRTMAPGHFSAKDLCAARVFELWVHFHGTEPGLKSVRAARAAEAFWLASGGKSISFGNALTGWRHHFETVNANKSTASLGRLRAVWRTDIEQGAQRGRPPWYFGTYFPPRAA